MKKEILLVVASVLLNGSAVNCDAIVGEPAIATVKKLQLPVAKVLKGKEVDLLNSVFASQPTAIWRTRAACNDILKTLKLINIKQGTFTKKEEEQTFVKEQVKLILAPVTAFFDEIRENSWLVIPVVEKSLIKEEAIKNSILIKFFTSTSQDFFAEEVKTISELQGVAVEFLTIFNDINKSLSKKAEDAFNKFIKDHSTNKSNTTSLKK